MTCVYRGGGWGAGSRGESWVEDEGGGARGCGVPLGGEGGAPWGTLGVKRSGHAQPRTVGLLNRRHECGGSVRVKERQFGSR
jgi:hypothetical protein